MHHRPDETVTEFGEVAASPPIPDPRPIPEPIPDPTPQPSPPPPEPSPYPPSPTAAGECRQDGCWVL
jgi:hypothetical protein